MFAVVWATCTRKVEEVHATGKKNVVHWDRKKVLKLGVIEVEH